MCIRMLCFGTFNLKESKNKDIFEMKLNYSRNHYEISYVVLSSVSTALYIINCDYNAVF